MQIAMLCSSVEDKEQGKGILIMGAEVGKITMPMQEDLIILNHPRQIIIITTSIKVTLALLWLKIIIILSAEELISK